MFFRYQDFVGYAGNLIVPPASQILKGSKMLEFADRRQNARFQRDTSKARKEFWRMKQAEHEREIKIFGNQKTAESLAARQS